jgi:Family of unknown function (DUF5394)
MSKDTHIGIFEQLTDDDSFDEEIEQILANFNEQTTDLTKLQTQIILIIKKYLKTKEHNLLKSNLSKLDEQIIAQNIRDATKHLMEEYSRINKAMHKGVADAKGNYQVDNKSRADLKRVIKNFAIYEVYKFMNPKRIAGETKQENFAKNVVARGFDSAKHYEGGSKQEIAGYDPKLIQKLENKHKSFKRGGSILGA